MDSAARTLVRSALRSDADDRLRASWRVAVPIALLLVVAQPLAFLPGAVAGLESLPTVHALSGLTIVALSGVVLALSMRADRRSLAGYGLRPSRRWGREFAAGIGFGFAMTGLTLLSSYALGLVRIDDVLVSGADQVLVAVPLLVIGWLCWAAMEEVLFRGIAIPNVAEGLSARGISPAAAVGGAVVISSLLFAVPHVWLVGPPADALASVALLSWTASGLLYGVAFVWTGNLAFPLGLHTTGNVATNVVFFGGLTADSEGMPTMVSVTATETGALFPVHGLLDIAVTLGAIAVVGGWVHRQRGGLSVPELTDRWTLESDGDAS